MRHTIARHRQVGSRLWWVCEHWTLTEQQAETQITSAVTVQWTMSSTSRCKAQEVHLGLFLCLDCLVYRIAIEATISADQKQPFYTLSSSILPFWTTVIPYLFLAFHFQLFIRAQFHFWFVVIIIYSDLLCWEWVNIEFHPVPCIHRIVYNFTLCNM